MFRHARLARFVPSIVALVLLGAPIVAYLAADGGRVAVLGYSLRAPDFSLLAAAPSAIQIHVAAALTALAIGIVLLAGIKGTRLHRALGWTWVLAMGTTAVSSFFIHTINPDGPAGLSFIHLISGWTVVSLPMAVHAARRHKVQAHRRAMTGMFVGGLIVAGALTFLPGRLMWAIFFG
ncbi:DUF2306 domain-containing protein [Brevundimonas sp. SL130]|uniref:DUF2306 domain-containing protein n=1 Tax=Brevundimonas sp. SL130 TaxID=2995143 RepID=UPI00226D1002|nr:DUF2306 domain-containing protein [Brevundimonas sp. SL130]WAC60444.1 DUF2306 domain-containing protein [Brevundimonas sp. SL130]